MDELERLSAIEEIRTLKARYCRGIDTHNWELLESLFADDAYMDLSSTKGSDVTGDRRRTGPAEIVKFIRSAVTEGSSAVHRGVMGEISFTSDHTADGIYAGNWDAWFAPDAPLRERHGAGYYYVSYEKRNGRWCIKTLRIGDVVHEEVAHWETAV